MRVCSFSSYLGLACLIGRFFLVGDEVFRQFCWVRLCAWLFACFYFVCVLVRLLIGLLVFVDLVVRSFLCLFVLLSFSSFNW